MCGWTHTKGREASAALPLALAVQPSACWRVGVGHASGEEGALGCAWTRTWEEGAEQALFLAKRAPFRTEKFYFSEVGGSGPPASLHTKKTIIF